VLIYSILKQINFVPDLAYYRDVFVLTVNILENEPVYSELDEVKPSTIITPTNGSTPIETQEVISSELKDLIEPDTKIDPNVKSIIATPKDKLLPEARTLIEQSYLASEETAREMESLVKLTDVFNQRFRDKLETARRKKNIEGKIIRPATGYP